MLRLAQHMLRHAQHKIKNAQATQFRKTLYPELARLRSSEEDRRMLMKVPPIYILGNNTASMEWITPLDWYTS